MLVSLFIGAAPAHAVSLATAAFRYRLESLSFTGQTASIVMQSKLAVEAVQENSFVLNDARTWSLRTQLSARYLQYDTPRGYALNGGGWLGLGAFAGVKWGADIFSWEVLGGVDKGYLAEEEQAGTIDWRVIISPRVLSSINWALLKGPSSRGWLKFGGAVSLPASVDRERSDLGVSGFSEISIDFMPAQVPLRFFTRFELGDSGWNRNTYRSIQFGIEIQLGITTAPLR